MPPPRARGDGPAPHRVRGALGRRDHPTADQVYDAVRGRLPGLSRTTVYRVLETLVGAGLRAQGAARGRRRRASTRSPSATTTSSATACGRLVDLDDAAVPPLRLPETRGTGFRITDYSVSFTGLCADCAKKKR